ncbi:MAG TPA: TonB-dependent receptor, partial [Terriglobales bacterium]|nr:TonB-dependent receptor [Terriglobales bacterium]
MKIKLSLLVLLISLLACSAWAQVAITGQIQGLVTDASGALLPGASLTVSSPALMANRTVKTQKDGSYLFDQLPPGTYQLSVSAPGFKTWVQRGIVINPGFTATIRPQLQVGEVQQSVEVTSEAPVVDVKGNETATTFDSSLLQNIPSGRDIWSTVDQAPGTTPDRFDVAGNQSFQQATMEVHGSQPGEQVYSFNGLRLNWPGATGGFTAFYIDHDSLQEFQVVSDNAPAEVGVGGVYMNMVPKSGSNEVHGLAAIYYDTAATQAGVNEPTYQGQPVNVGSPMIMTRDSTVNLGGPLIKNKWWAFGSWRLYALKESVLSVRRQDGSPIADPNHQTNVTLRSDYQLTTNNRLNFDWWYNEQNRFFRRDEGYAFVAEQASWRQIEPAYILQGNWNSVIKNNLVLDTRFGYMHLLFPLGAQSSVTPADFSRIDPLQQTVTGAPIYTFLNPSQVLAFSSSASYYKGNWGGSHNFK